MRKSKIVVCFLAGVLTVFAQTDRGTITGTIADPTGALVANAAVEAKNVATDQVYSGNRGFRYPNENANFGRTFRITERVVFNVRAEFTNVFNRTRLPQPTASGFATAPSIQQAGPLKGLYSAGFGTVVPTGGTQGYRAGTLVGRITF